MPNAIQKLIKLLHEADKECCNKSCITCKRQHERFFCKLYFYADHLISNGVMIQEHGQWVQECKNHYKCSNCGHGRNTDTQIGWNFCPNCGAKMDLPKITKQTIAAMEAMDKNAHSRREVIGNETN